DISLKINSGERIGIVGRTGAGKSSLTRALFRLVEGESGSILVDGVDISKLHASSLRPNLAIIPQDATSFAGSLRTNLDPLKQFTIEDMWAALIKAQLVEIANPKERHGKSKARSSEGEVDDDLGYSWESKKQRRKRLSSGWLMRSFLWLFKERDNTAEFLSRQRDWGLSKNLGDDGEGFTAGQWQQFGLARVLLRKRKILVLDEATADVDNKTDKVIHEAIHKEFAGCTILTIAHRLETVMNSDRIIVMDHGRVAEFDTPANLLAKGGLFAELVKSDGFANI
ncbi:ATP-binding cassette glutathione S-conjugate transporter ycf1, partial [Linderina macrospora]